MEELIRITNQNGKKAVNARDLYVHLSGEGGKHFSEWAQRNIVKNDFAVQDTDYHILPHHGGKGRPSVEYVISIDFAKELCMMSQCAKGKEARLYFIEIEKTFKSILPTDYKSALKQLVAQVEINEIYEQRLIEQQPKVDFYDAVGSSKDTVDIGEVAKILNMGIGRNKLFQLLRDKKVLMDNNQPYQKYVTAQWFKLIEQPYKKKDGSVHINIKTVVFNKGMQEIRKLAM